MDYKLPFPCNIAHKIWAKDSRIDWLNYFKEAQISIPSMHGPWYTPSTDNYYVPKEFDVKLHQKQINQLYKGN